MNDDDKKQAVAKILRESPSGSNIDYVSEEILKILFGEVEEKEKTKAEEWEERRLICWNQLQEARILYHKLFTLYRDQGFERSNPYEGKE